MSSHTFDNVETTLKSLKDIVDRNHSQSDETSQLVEDMELLIFEMKIKTKTETRVNMIDPTALVVAIPPPVVFSI